MLMHGMNRSSSTTYSLLAIDSAPRSDWAEAR
jgi:hypothetical protein